MFSILESMEKIKKSPVDLIKEEINRLLQITKYGWLNQREKRIITPNDKEWEEKNYFEKNCRVLSPSEVLKYKVGTCWDFSVYVADYIKKKFNLDSDIYFINNKNFTVTHTFIVFKYDNNIWIIEPTISRDGVFGVHKVNLPMSTFIKKLYKNNLSIDTINKHDSKEIISVAYNKKLTAHKFISFFFRLFPTKQLNILRSYIEIINSAGRVSSPFPLPPPPVLILITSGYSWQSVTDP